MAGDAEIVRLHAQAIPEPEQPATHEAPAPELLTVDEVAALLRTSRAAIYTMVHRRELPGVVRLGRRVLVRRLTLMTWLHGLEESAPNASTPEEPAHPSRRRGPAVRLGTEEARCRRTEKRR